MRDLETVSQKWSVLIISLFSELRGPHGSGDRKSVRARRDAGPPKKQSPLNQLSKAHTNSQRLRQNAYVLPISDQFLSTFFYGFQFSISLGFPRVWLSDSLNLVISQAFLLLLVCLVQHPCDRFYFLLLHFTCFFYIWHYSKGNDGTVILAAERGQKKSLFFNEMVMKYIKQSGTDLLLAIVDQQIIDSLSLPKMYYYYIIWIY